MRKSLFAVALVLTFAAKASHAVIYDWDVGYTPGLLDGQGPWTDQNVGTSNTYTIIAGQGIGAGHALNIDYGVVSWAKARNPTSHFWAVGDPLRFSADFRVVNGAADATTNYTAAILTFIAAAQPDSGGDARDVITVDYTVSNNQWSVDGVNLAAPLVDFDATSDWLRVESTLVKWDDDPAAAPDRWSVETVIYSLGSDGSGLPTPIETVVVTNDLWGMWSNATLSVSLTKGSVDAQPNASIYIDNIVVDEPERVPSTPVVLPEVLVVEGLALFMDEASQLQYTTDLATPTWSTVDDVRVTPSSGRARFVDPHPMDGSRLYRVAN